MSNQETSRIITNADVKIIAEDISHDLGFLDEPEFICYGQPTWVIKGNDSTDPANAMAVRLRHTTDPEASIIETAEQVYLMQKLRACGARVVEFVHEPWIEKGPDDMPGAFVVSLSKYLPGKANSYQYGSAIATLHDASGQLDLSSYNRMDPLQSITPVKTAITVAEERYEEGKPVEIDGVRVTKQHISKLWRTFNIANDLRNQLFETALRNGSPLVVVQEDVYSNNAGTDWDGTETLMDVDPLVGPAAMDFGRPLNDWRRFKGKSEDAKAYVDGYINTVSDHKLPPKDELDLAMQFSDHRTPLMVSCLAINGIRTGHHGDAWQLQEGLRRLDLIGRPEEAWFADDNARRTAMRSQNS